jgi:Mg/Co/Ni transporter MgtE
MPAALTAPLLVASVRLRAAGRVHRTEVRVGLMLGVVLASIAALTQPVTGGMLAWAGLGALTFGTQAAIWVSVTQDRSLLADAVIAFYAVMASSMAVMAGLWALPVVFGA